MERFVILCILISAVSTEHFQKWQKTKDGCLYYIEIRQEFNWYEAVHQCARINMRILTLDTFYKHHQLSGLFEAIFPYCPRLWIGGHDNAIEKHHQWITNGQLFTFTNWADGEPTGNEHCVAIWRDKWEWNDLPCSMKLGFICEENRCDTPRELDLEEQRQLLKETQFEIEQLKNSQIPDGIRGALNNYNYYFFMKPKPTDVNGTSLEN